MKQPHAYRDLSPDHLEELFSNYLIDSWSYSKVSSFSRNEKAFEMSYIYRCPYKNSASTVAGKAYHEALDKYFSAKMEGNVLDLVDLEKIAFEYIEEVLPTEWKVQKTTPTIEECKKKAYKVVHFSLSSFYKELSTYDLKEVIAVELYCDEFLTINGVDVPLPCHAKIDVVAKTNDDKIVIIDHKLRAKYSDEKELAFSVGKQAVTYFHCIKSSLGLVADEVWFVENKHSKNRDGSAQLKCFKVTMDEDTVKLYDSLLYEPLKKMIEAVSDPDYVYMINDNDNFVDRAELYEFWGHTMIAEVEEFNIPESKKEMVSRRLKKIRDASISTINPKVVKNFTDNASQFIQYNLNNKDMTKQDKIEHVLKTLSIGVQIEHTFEGYSSDTYLLKVSAGTNISTIFRYKLDIANALNVPSIIIKKDLFIYEGDSYVAIESSKPREKDLIFNKKHLVGQKIPVGMDNFNKPVIWDLNNPSTPHMLICGATGSGKSVAIKSIIEYAKLSGVDNVVIFDPKYEFLSHSKNPNIEVYNDVEVIEEKMAELVTEMNDLIQSGKKQKTLVVFDEFADALSAARKGKELDIKEMVQVGNYAPKKGFMGMMMPGEPKMKLQKTGQLKSLEENLKILLQKGRSTGFRIIAATQRASVKVITGDAKVNFPVRICFMVPKELDSKVVLDESGAEALAGKGDGLIRSPEYMDLVRFQSFYIPE